MKKPFSIVLSVLVFAVTALSVAAFSGAAEDCTLIYKIDFEEENAASVMMAGGEIVGEVVEWPAGSGNHALKYIISPDTYFERPNGRHPYIMPSGLSNALAIQGGIPSDIKIRFSVRVGCDDEIVPEAPDKEAHMYPVMRTSVGWRDEKENRFQSEDGSFVPGVGSFKTGQFSFINSSDFEEALIAGFENGSINLCDDGTLGVEMQEQAIYYDDITLEWYGRWMPVVDILLCYPGTNIPLPHSDINNAYEGEYQTSGGDFSEISDESGDTSDTSDTPEIVSGDVNNDGFVDMKDVLALRKFLAGMDIQINVLNADANRDDVTDLKDVLMIRKRLANLL